VVVERRYEFDVDSNSYRFRKIRVSAGEPPSVDEVSLPGLEGVSLTKEKPVNITIQSGLSWTKGNQTAQYTAEKEEDD